MNWFTRALRSFASAFKPRKGPDLSWTKTRIPKADKPVSPEWKHTSYTYSTTDADGNTEYRDMTPAERRAFDKGFAELSKGFEHLQKAFDTLNKSK